MTAPSVAQEPEATKRIAFTFDDVPRAVGMLYTQDERTQRLIEGLKEAGVEQAAFFLNPKNIPTNKGADAHIDAYVAAGHVIANHTFSHPRLSQVSAADFLADLDEGAVWFEGRAGTRPWFRFPYLDEGRDDKVKRDAARAGLAKRGLTNAYVTVDASDWFYEGALEDAVREGQTINREALSALFIESHVEAAEFYADLAQRALGRQPAHVMLMHENDLTALTLVDLIAALRAKGWKIITADEAYADPIASEAARYDTPSAGGTLTEMLAWQKGLPSPRWYARNNTRLARSEFRNRVLGGGDNFED
ncbi:MAG: polysaccharide deacetylase family protein [Pseudomonadota bacterium]